MHFTGVLEATSYLGDEFEFANICNNHWCIRSTKRGTINIFHGRLGYTLTYDSGFLYGVLQDKSTYHAFRLSLIYPLLEWS